MTSNDFITFRKLEGLDHKYRRILCALEFAECCSTNSLQLFHMYVWMLETFKANYSLEFSPYVSYSVSQIFFFSEQLEIFFLV